MKYFVTGATGFIGSHLCRALLAKGDEVFGLVRNSEKLYPDLVDAGFQSVHGDLSLFCKEDTILPEVDYVIHLAGVVAGKNLAEYAEVNTKATQDVLTCLEGQSWKPKRFLLASSLAAYGPTQGDFFWSEEDAPSPIDPYGIAKLEAEKLLCQASFPTTAFRPGIVLGWGDPATLTLFKMAKSGFAALPIGPQQKISFIDVQDAVTGIIAMCTEQDDERQSYFLVSNEIVGSDDILHAMAKVFGSSVFIAKIPKFVLWTAMVLSTFFSKIFGYTNQLDLKQYKQITAPNFLCRSAKLQEKTGWTPQLGLETSLKRAVDGYKDLGLL